MISEKVLALVEKIKKKAGPGKCYKQSVQNISYFNKERTFMIRKKQKIDKITDYRVTDVQNYRKASEIFQRIELFATRANFIM